MAEPKPIEITHHAEERMAKRGVSHNQVINTIRAPTAREPGATEFSQVYSRIFHPNRLLVAVVEETDDVFRVVTVYWKPL